MADHVIPRLAPTDPYDRAGWSATILWILLVYAATAAAGLNR